MERQGQPKGAQVHVMPLDDQRGGARHHFSVGSGGKGILLEIPAYLRPSEGEQLFFLCFRIHCCTWAYAHLLQPGTLLGLPCCYCCVFHHIIALHHPVGSQTSQKKKNLHQYHSSSFSLVLCDASVSVGYCLTCMYTYITFGTMSPIYFHGNCNSHKKHNTL